ncbi:SDR family NAD(P)-dependent oxidoreductase [Amycolatopsis silviterrae]|uniref:SDR family NAD(P)-dependent oxidoreductase n=1 Tax=Amycolatopsis silviterrae TaxID=1656914 RepID=A0ABW5H559_9PSEU
MNGAKPPSLPAAATGCYVSLPERSADEPSEDRVALVSGASGGLGLKIVRMLAANGMRVVLASRSIAGGRAAVDLLGDLADRVAVRELDVNDADSIARLAAWLFRALGRCDVLVNNEAVLLDENGGASTADPQLVRRTVETNLIGAWQLTQAVVPLMRIHRYGRIVNISSELGSLASMRADLPAYRVSKCAVNALTRVLADELACSGILVNACGPGPAGDGSDAIGQSASPAVPVWLASLPDDGPTGSFYGERDVLDW